MYQRMVERKRRNNSRLPTSLMNREINLFSFSSYLLDFLKRRKFNRSPRKLRHIANSLPLLVLVKRHYAPPFLDTSVFPSVPSRMNCSSQKPYIDAIVKCISYEKKWGKGNGEQETGEKLKQNFPKYLFLNLEPLKEIVYGNVSDVRSTVGPRFRGNAYKGDRI